ncbi:hypothetical protein [Gilvimarinus algae]|uniref:Uncharacterized protein n=1 Tax=Gilvimarinus algae TaxID=3058037 RepID=A0ABT8TG81_9GAMM|nr:hypothetical protein [Gilvimarinus sp. SDUM040014]MDO3383087.1 hypothetical protein [Gilvimarinus sp. SDUM040014]
MVIDFFILVRRREGTRSCSLLLANLSQRVEESGGKQGRDCNLQKNVKKVVKNNKMAVGRR